MVSFNKQNILTPITVSIFLPCACFSLALWIFLCLIGGCLFFCVCWRHGCREESQEWDLITGFGSSGPAECQSWQSETHTHTHTHCDLTACDTLTFSHTSILVRVCRWLNAIPLTHSPETSITTDTRLNLSLTLTYNDSNISATRKCRPSNNHL